MAADESKNDPQTESEGGQGTTPPSTPYAKEDVKRTGTKEDIRSTDSDTSGGGTSDEPDTLRNGTLRNGT